MATLYRAETTLQDILGMKVGDELQLAGGDLPDYTEDDAGKALQVNQAGTGLEWGPGIPSFTSSDVGKVLTVGEEAGEPAELFPMLSVTGSEDNPEPVDIVNANTSLFVAGATVNLTATDTTLGQAYYVTGTVIERWPGVMGLMDETTNITLLMQGNEMVIIIPITGTFSVTATVASSKIAPMWKTGDGVYLVHIDAETMTIEEDFADVADAYTKMPVYLISPYGSALYSISNTDGENLFSYAFEVVPGIGTASARLGITQIRISNTGSLTIQRYTADVTIAE